MDKADEYLISVVETLQDEISGIFTSIQVKLATKESTCDDIALSLAKLQGTVSVILTFIDTGFGGYYPSGVSEQVYKALQDTINAQHDCLFARLVSLHKEIMPR